MDVKKLCDGIYLLDFYEYTAIRVNIKKVDLPKFFMRFAGEVREDEAFFYTSFSHTCIQMLNNLPHYAGLGHQWTLKKLELNGKVELGTILVFSNDLGVKMVEGFRPDGTIVLSRGALVTEENAEKIINIIR